MADLLPDIGSMHDVYFFCITKRITKFARASSAFSSAAVKNFSTLE
jgi:hypothetical protein